jgi:YbbR domain-containing protein
MKNKRIHIIFGAAMFAGLLWVIVNMRDQYQTTIATPLVVENIPQGKAIQTPIPQYIFLKCRSDGWRLAGLTLGGEVRCVLDIGSLPSSQTVLTLKDVVERLNLPLGIQPITMKPESLFVTLDRFTQKRLPVVLDGQLSFKEGYGLVGSPTVTPETVQIGGAETVLRTISFWRTAHTVFENLKASVETDVSLADTSLYKLRFRPALVRIRVNVQPFAEKPFSGLPVEVLSVPGNREVIVIPPKIDIVVRGGIDQLSALSLRDFRASVDYNDLVNDTSGYMDPLIVPPAGVQLVSKRPERLQYIVRKRL